MNTITSPVPPATFQGLVPNPPAQSLETELVGGIFTFRDLVNEFYGWLMSTCVDDAGNPYACPSNDFSNFICQVSGITTSTTTVTTTSSTTTSSSTTTTTLTTSASAKIILQSFGLSNPSRIAYTGPTSINTVTIHVTVNAIFGGDFCFNWNGSPLPVDLLLTSPSGTEVTIQNQPIIACSYDSGTHQTQFNASGAYGPFAGGFSGLNANGVWQLIVDCDQVGGTLVWSLEFS